MRRTIILCLYFLGISLSWAQNSPKIKYTISNGLQIEGLDQTNPVIYDNDMVEDTPEDEFLWLKAHNGEVNLVGNIITRDMDKCTTGTCKRTMQFSVTEFDRAIKIARSAGLSTVPEPVLGADAILRRPASGRIEDTQYKISVGSELIIREAKKASAAKPLIIFVGGQATTVANAYLKDPSIAERIIVFHVYGHYDRYNVPTSYNTQDPWSAYVVMKKIRYINFTGDLRSWYWRPVKNVNLTQSMINSLPNNPLANALKTWYTRFFKNESLADAPPILYFFNHSLFKNVVRKLENGQTTTSDTFDYLMTSDNDWTNYGPELIKYMKDPSNYAGSPANKLPAVNVTSPGNNADYTAGEAITLSANASDSDGNITKVEFFYGQTKLGEDPAPPYSFQWTKVPAGKHIITGKATDNRGGTSTSAPVTITVSPGNTLPSIVMTSPVNNDKFSSGATISLGANASDTDGNIVKVEFFNGPTKLGEDVMAPYSFQWTEVPTGKYTITGKATDNGGGASTSAPVTITVSAANTPPSVILTSPTSNDKFSSGATISLDANATDTDGNIAKVEFFNGDAKLGEDLSEPFSFTWSNVSPGTYNLKAKATDNVSASTTSTTVNISVDAPANSAPVVTLTAPVNNATFTSGSSINISANASDPGGAVQKVEFYSGATKLGEDTSGPYAFEWKNIPAGDHTLSAKVTDSQGAVTTSSQVKIKVTPPNTAPAVAITAPSNNASFTSGSSINITASATDAQDATIKVEFYHGTTKIGEDLSSPYSFEWKNTAAGSYSLTAKATDSQGATTTSSPIPIKVSNPNDIPMVNITAPANNTVFTTGVSVTIRANASDNNGIKKVEFFQGTNKLGEDNSSPYSFAWGNVPAGDYKITAKAIDNQSAISVSQVINIKVKVNAPTYTHSISITAPANNATFTTGESVTITAAAESSTKVEFFNGSVKLGEDLTSPYSFVWNDIPAGTYTLTAKASTHTNVSVSSAAIKIIVTDAAHPIINANAGEDISISLPENTVALTGDGESSDGSQLDFQWQQVSGPEEIAIENANTSDITLTNLAEGVYVFELTVLHSMGHSAKDQVKVDVISLPLADVSQTLIPRYFTPNDDGINDLWTFPEHELLENARVTIFNRSGQKIYEAYAYQAPWDGKLEGKPLDEDAYYYVIRLSDNNDIKGAVRIIR